jgi:uncharacterized protein YozE (UPF0346 family)
MKKKVILISGKMRSGKNQFAEYLKQQFRSKSFSTKEDLFAKDLKDGCKKDFKALSTYLNDQVTRILSLLSINDTVFKEYNAQVKEEVKKLIIKDENWYENKTEMTRLLLQLYGTEIFRNRVDENHWVNQVKNRAIATDKDIYIVTDTRFTNEIEGMYSEADYDLITIRINRPMDRKGSENQHKSETGLDRYKNWNYVIHNNKDLKHLQKCSRTVAIDIIENDDLMNWRWFDAGTQYI